MKKISQFQQIITRNDEDWLLIEEASTGAYKKIKISDFIAGIDGGGSHIKLTGIAFGTSPAFAAGSEFDKAFDGNTATYFDYLNPSGGYVGIDLGAGQSASIKKIRFYPRPNWINRMLGGRFQGSNSLDTGYSDLYVIGSTPAEGWNEALLTGTASYRYLRYLSPNNSYGNVSEIEFYK